MDARGIASYEDERPKVTVSVADAVRSVLVNRLWPGEAMMVRGVRVLRYRPPSGYDGRFCQDTRQYSLNGGEWVGLETAVLALIRDSY